MLAGINSNMFQIEIIENGKGGHDDLIVNIEGLVNKVLDTYYFKIGIEQLEGLQDIKNDVAKLLLYWKEEILTVKDGKKIHLPIDFSDQYCGCVEVLRSGKNLQLKYGYIEARAGWNICPSDPGDFSKTIADFKDTENITFEVYKTDFLTAIESQITKLTYVS